MSSLKDITLFLKESDQELFAEPMNDQTSSTRNAG